MTKLLRRTAALALAAALIAPPVLAQPAGPPTYYLFLYKAGPAWKTGQPLAAQGLGQHGAYMAQLFKDGVLYAGGPASDPQGSGLAIVKAKDAAEAKALLANDPAVKAGIMAAELQTWRPVFISKASLLP